MLTREFSCAVKLRRKLFIKNFVNKRRFARTRNARYGNEHTERNFNVDIFKVILPRALYFKKLAVALPALFRNFNLLFARKVSARY